MNQLINSGAWIRCLLLLSLTALLIACQPGPVAATQSGNTGEVFQVVSTTSILGDVVSQVAGEDVSLSVLVPTGSDPHSFQPTPRDIQKISQADLVFINGAGLEPFMDSLIESGIGSSETSKVVAVSEGVNFRHDAHEAQSSAEDGEVDPHVWFNPQNVIIWTENIERSLNQADPANAARFTTNAEAYRVELEGLDAWITDQVSKIPLERRKLVTDHENLGYFADQYGFQQIGAVIPSVSAAAEPSAEDLAALIDAVRAQDVQAIFVGTTVSPNLAQRVADDTGTRLVSIYTDSLTPPGGEASTYVDLMRYDVQAIVEALQ